MVRASRVRAQRRATRAAPRDWGCTAPAYVALRTRARRGHRAARRTQTLLSFAPMACSAELEVPNLRALAEPLAPADLPDRLFAEADNFRDRLRRRQQALAANNAIVDPAVDRQIKQRLAACTLAPYLPS